MDLKHATFLAAEAAHFALSTLHALLQDEGAKAKAQEAIDLLLPIWSTALKENGAS